MEVAEKSRLGQAGLATRSRSHHREPRHESAYRIGGDWPAPTQHSAVSPRRKSLGLYRLAAIRICLVTL